VINDGKIPSQLGSVGAYFKDGELLHYPQLVKRRKTGAYRALTIDIITYFYLLTYLYVELITDINCCNTPNVGAHRNVMTTAILAVLVFGQHRH